jgi:CMP-N-acetylneuraminic acid synthetase
MLKMVAVIPARGGSKEISRKNVRLLNGKPLIAYSIEAALKSRCINRIIVSTEDQEIAEISKRYGVEVIDRPKELATDDSPTIDVVLHALGLLERDVYIPDVVVLLQPTSPLRNAGDIDNATELFLSDDCESVVSVCEIEHSPYWSFKIENGYLKPIFGENYVKMRRQDVPKTYVPNGAIYVSKPEILRRYKSFYCSKMIPYIMPFERSVDINTDFDLLLAEFILLRKREK